MKKYRNGSYLLMSVILTFSLVLTVYANSSWVWLTGVTPFYILPIAVLITISVETLMISKQVEEGNFFKIIFFVLVANISSFVLPYLLEYSEARMVCDTFDQYLHKGPTYMIGFVYLLLTLISEVPIVYNALKKNAKETNKLFKFVLISNVITTTIVAVLERAFCRGRW